MFTGAQGKDITKLTVDKCTAPSRMKFLVTLGLSSSDDGVFAERDGDESALRLEELQQDRPWDQKYVITSIFDETLRKKKYG